MWTTSSGARATQATFRLRAHFQTILAFSDIDPKSGWFHHPLFCETIFQWPMCIGQGAEAEYAEFPEKCHATSWADETAQIHGRLPKKSFT